MNTDGQNLAIEQLREIEAASDGTLEILSVSNAAETDGFAFVQLSVECSAMPRATGGLPLRDRERLGIVISPTFPFKLPAVGTLHERWAGHPHVQWKHELCLYQSIATEWDASDGMFGFITRLDKWLRQGALGQLDPTGAPLHPPVAYISKGPTRMVIPRVDTPSVTDSEWLGYANLQIKSDTRVDIVGWSEIGSSHEVTPGGSIGAAILLPTAFPFEFPDKVSGLITELERAGISRNLLFLILQFALSHNENDAPLYVLIGTAMRGIQGGARLQHLTAWYLEPIMVTGLRLAFNKYTEEVRLKELGEECEQIVLEWAKTADVTWCAVREDRPEIVLRRDIDSPLSWFRGKSVSIWGCGALGSHVAEILARTGIAKLILSDKSTVAPGILVRQQYDDADVGRAKVHALRERILRIRPDLDIEAKPRDLLKAVTADTWTDGADIVIDTTASETVHIKLELLRKSSAFVPVPIVGFAIGHQARNSLAVLAKPDHSGGIVDVYRSTKIATCNDAGLSGYADEFWPKEARTDFFQPEPGCSETTFTGSAADIAALTGAMLNSIASDLSADADNTAFAHLQVQPYAAPRGEQRLVVSLCWRPDRTFTDPHSGYFVRVSHSAWAEMMGWAARSHRVNGEKVETGGLLFGQRNDVLKVLWVSEASGPPPDSGASASLFKCGTQGTKDLNDINGKRTRGAVEYIGMWHTHPNGLPLPSPTDLDAMETLVTAIDVAPRRSLLFILGSPQKTPIGATYVFSREDFDNRPGDARYRDCAIKAPPADEKVRRVALALSGGGSRAIAFHLGCMRALHDRGVLEQIDVISSVSGGSVIAALYAYSEESFEDFEAKIVQLLRKGLMGGIVRRTFASRVMPGWLATVAVSGSAAMGSFALRTGVRGILGKKAEPLDKYRSPLPRWFSRTTALKHTLRDTVLGRKMVGDKTRGGITTIINACELRTGTAFRFGNSSSSCWRYGQVLNNEVTLAEAVTASAAYPALLPAIDRYFNFVDRKGNHLRRRVLLSDGGTYDNQGITAIEPGRSQDYNYITVEPEYIISCDAGAGQFSGEDIPYWWPLRMLRSFESVFRRVQHSNQERLHRHVESGRLKGFVYSYLGQQDYQLPYAPPDLVKRSDVVSYPTNFSGMKQTDIDRLAARGEQLTRLLIARYCPDL